MNLDQEGARMNILKNAVLTLVGLTGLSLFSNSPQTNQNQMVNHQPETDSLNANSYKATQDCMHDQLLERLDVDQFQNQNGMLVATNHVTGR